MNFYGRDFLKIMDYSETELRHVLNVAKRFKQLKHNRQSHASLRGKNIALLFEKTSTRTRCAFEVAAHDLGAHVTYLDPTGSQMGHKESIADTARVLDRFYDGIEFRGFAQSTVETIAQYASAPVWNGLTDYCHPTQALADFMTLEEHFNTLKGLTLAFVGDIKNNVSNSLMAMSAKMGMNFILCGPKERQPDPNLFTECQSLATKNGATLTITHDINSLNGVADAIYTDVWLSLGEPPEQWQERINLLKPYQVTMNVMNQAKPTTVFLHALPSFHDLNTTIAQDIHTRFNLSEMEVTNEVFESDRSLVFDEAENRMHTIKAIIFLSLYQQKEAQ